MLNQDPVELGLAGKVPELLARLREVPRYRTLFATAYPDAQDPVTLENVTAALACFQRTLISGGSSYDRRLFEDDDEALSPEALRGMELFFSKRVGCGGCHAGLNLSGPTRGLDGGADLPPRFHDTGLRDPRDHGLARETGEESDRGRFRAPSLRNVAVTAPYMHDGRFPTLEAVLGHYAAGAGGELRPVELSALEFAEMIAFLESLTDPDFLRDPRFGDPWGPR
jgi:cytochrome c peroxidase